MLNQHRFVYILTCAVFCACISILRFATTPVPTAQLSRVSAQASEAQPQAACLVVPLDPITDPAARQLEAEADAISGGAVDVAGMRPAAARALDLFESKVESMGGSIILKSAYRPASYQKHLQNVWYKWMELKDNTDLGCQELRDEVQQEFARHHLIESQHPVAESDHTRGLAFDATVSLPGKARVGRRSPTLDHLAHLAGFLRPAIASDPVHFKYVGGQRASAARRRNVHNS